MTLLRAAIAAFGIAALVAPAGLVAADQDPFPIVAIIPITGTAAFNGREQAKTLVALQDYVNATGGIRGRPIKFEVLDDQSSPQIAVQLVNQAIADHAAALMGPGFAAQCGAAMPLVANGPVAYCFSPGVHPPAGSFMFSSSFSTIDQIAVMFRYIREKGYKKLAVISTTDASGQDGERAIDAALALPANAGLTVVAREHYAPADLSVAGQAARIKSAAPQAVIAWVSAAPIATFLRNSSEVGLDIPVFTTPANQTYDQMAAYAGYLPHELLFPSGPFSAPDQITDRAVRAAVQALYDSLAKQNARPGFPTQTDWDPGLLLVSAYRKLGTDATAEQVRAYLAGLRGWVGENGRYDFVAVPQRGLDGSTTVIVRWDPAKGTWVAASKLGGEPVK
jgi:branched-chain amino acid transport system substrate-binding protein